jgi:hypothetical protein
MGRLLLAATACGALVLAPAAGRPAPPRAAEVADGEPDLTVSRERLRDSINIRTRDANAGDCTLVEGCLGGLGKRRTLEFDTYTVNAGDGDLRLGSPADHPGLFEFSRCHGHYHLKDSFVYAVGHGGADSVGLFDPAAGRVMFRNERTTGAPDGAFDLSAAPSGAISVAGDWDRTGPSRPGLYDPATGHFTLVGKNAASTLDFDYRPETGALLPVAGDWNGDGIDTVGLYSPATHTFYLKRKNSKNRKADTVVVDPGPGDWVPIAGDWNDDDVDTVGLYDRATGVFALKDANASGAPDLTFAFGEPGMVPIAGDWNRDGVDTVGIYDPATATFMLRDENSAGEPDATMSIEAGAAAAALSPVAGDWDYEVGDVLVPGNKEAFCWLDTQRILGNRDMQFRDCNTDQGLTAGWCDIYIRNTDCQWIDITGLAPGNYQLTVTVNPLGRIRESDPTNNSASVKVHVPEPRRLAKAPEVTVTSPGPGREFAVGEAVKIRWSVAGGRGVSHQEIWLADVTDDHPSKVALIAARVPPGARSFTWVPTDEFEIGAAQIIVRAQDDAGFVGTDARSRGAFRIRK